MCTYEYILSQDFSLVCYRREHGKKFSLGLPLYAYLELEWLQVLIGLIVGRSWLVVSETFYGREDGEGNKRGSELGGNMFLMF